ncbi:ribbon-helix-helix domain-containing protein [Microbacterium lacus]|uniref:ribbon-helix-helix domain-containing protein n=1 Tax=Microbacterium lacus TaxID=415217 RepID=UPI000C2B5E20|nr:ribbon-helix-helix domain-containing protein [Microbacterium lacus]
MSVQTQIPAEVDHAVDELAAVSGGVSKAAILRQAILTGLQQFADTNPELAAALANAPVTETSAA